MKHTTRRPTIELVKVKANCSLLCCLVSCCISPLKPMQIVFIQRNATPQSRLCTLHRYKCTPNSQSNDDQTNCPAIIFPCLISHIFDAIEIVNRPSCVFGGRCRIISNHEIVTINYYYYFYGKRIEYVTLARKDYWQSIDEDALELRVARE